MTAEKIGIKITGMDCPGCAEAVAGYLKQDRGIIEVNLDWHQGTGEVTFDPGVTDRGQVLKSRAFSGRFCAELVKLVARQRKLLKAGKACDEGL